VLRDGLGPDAVDSHGGPAVARFLMTFYWGPVMVALALLTLGAVFWAGYCARLEQPDG
jgi:hypothetical protein